MEAGSPAVFLFGAIERGRLFSSRPGRRSPGEDGSSGPFGLDELPESAHEDGKVRDERADFTNEHLTVSLCRP